MVATIRKGLGYSKLKVIAWLSTVSHLLEIKPSYIWCMQMNIFYMVVYIQTRKVDQSYSMQFNSQQGDQLCKVQCCNSAALVAGLHLNIRPKGSRAMVRVN